MPSAISVLAWSGWLMNQLVGEQQALNAAAAQFRTYCDKQAGAAS